MTHDPNCAKPLLTPVDRNGDPKEEPGRDMAVTS
jgi:hypothetical protein